MSRITSLLTGLVLLATGPGALAATVEVFSFTNLNRAIPDGNWSGLSDTHTINSSVSILTSLRVKLHLDGEFNGDLYAYLRHTQPGRTNLCVLLNRVGRSATNSTGYADTGFDVTFDDASANGDVHIYRTVLQPPRGTPLTGVWQPDGRKVDPALVTSDSPRTTSLGDFTGAAGSGEWTVYLADVESGGTNQLVGWELELHGAVPAPLTWLTPTNIVYGTPLGAAQLNATSSVPGATVYTPPAGTVLNAGADQTLWITFTPSDTNYVAVTTNVTLTVLPKDLTITPENKTKVYGAELPELTASYDGFVNGDTTAKLTSLAVLSTTATASSPAGTYPITPSGASSTNYSISYVDGLLTIGQATAAGSLVSSKNPAQPGELVSFTFTATAVPPGAGTPQGNVTFRVDGSPSTRSLSGGQAQFSTSTLTVGTHTVVAEYLGNGDFLGVTNTLAPIQLINTPPVAGLDILQRCGTNDTKVAITTFLTNDYDADGDSITFVSFSTNSAHGGTLTQADGWLYYTPAPGDTNDDTFTYTISDGRGTPVTGTVSVVVVADVIPAPNLAVTDLGGGSYRIRGDGIPGKVYRVQWTEDLAAPNWQLVNSGTANGDGWFEVIDNPGVGQPKRFYRSIYP
jgi:subtilisin-like proprotein convertase family protein